MKWILMLFSIFKSLTNSCDDGESSNSFNPIEDFKDMVKDNAVNMTLSYMAATILSIIFSLGLITVLLNMAMQYDSTATIVCSAVIAIGLFLMIVPLIIVKCTVIKYKKESKKEKEYIVKQPSSNVLQESVAMLIQDYIREREFKRTQESQKTAPETNTEL